MTTTVSISAVADGSPSPQKSGSHAQPAPLRQGIRVFTSADIAAWEACLQERTELCLSVAGTARGKLTLYAGPDHRGGVPVAVLTGIDDASYVSRPWTPDIEAWVASVLKSAASLNDAWT